MRKTKQSPCIDDNGEGNIIIKDKNVRIGMDVCVVDKVLRDGKIITFLCKKTYTEDPGTGDPEEKRGGQWKILQVKPGRIKLLAM